MTNIRCSWPCLGPGGAAEASRLLNGIISLAINQFPSPLRGCVPTIGFIPRVRSAHPGLRSVAPPGLNCRRAFTLLEIIVAVTIGMMLLVGLYLAVNVQLRTAQISRDMIEESNLARQLCLRMQTDIERSLGPFDPSVLAKPGSGTSTTTKPSTGSGSSSSSSTTPSSGGTTGSSSASSVAASYNLGLQGTADSLMIFASHVPKRTAADAGNATGVGDFHHITYEMSSEQDVSGLVRRDVALIQADDGTWDIVDGQIESVPPQLVSPEVQGVQFSYLDAVNGWVTEWPGGAAAYDGTTQIGPPLAVKIVLTIQLKNGDNRDFTHIVPIRTANGISLKDLGQLPQGTTGGMP